MDRTVPRTGSEDIELYIRTYYSLLRSSAEAQIRTLEEVHANIGSVLHPDAHAARPDISALIYSCLRLPACIGKVRRVVLGQTEAVFQQHGYGDVTQWEPVSAKARRRRCYYDGGETLACLIASGTDIDDIVPMLTAFQIEWNKLNRLMKGEQVRAFLTGAKDDPDGLTALAIGLGLDPDDLRRLQLVWGHDFWDQMSAMSSQERNFRLHLLAGSLTDYRKATQLWWDHVMQEVPELAASPVYFVSSNPHSLVNLLSGFALRHQEELVNALRRPHNAGLLAEWNEIEARNVPSSRENLLYYVQKKHMVSAEGAEMARLRAEDEAALGIRRIHAPSGFDSEVQVVPLRRLRLDWVDPRLRRPELDNLSRSDAYLVNIDYPLGTAAYLILTYLASRVGSLLGVYVMGKAATLNGVIGDVMISSVVHDEHSQNTYLMDNCFTAADVGNDLVYGTVMDNQKTVSVRGTFLQTPRYMDVFYREGYTVIEMEAGPYLSAVYELSRPKRHPVNEIVDLHRLPFDLGFLHYASDTPLGKGDNLGAGSLSYFGMDPTYSTSLAILKRILSVELDRTQRDSEGQPGSRSRGGE
jgi:hypothetical protein